MSTAPTPAQLAERMAALTSAWRLYVEQLAAWLAGTAEGGPEGTGRYPLTDAFGTTYMVDCPARMQARVDTAADSAGTYAEAASGSAEDALAALSAAQAAQQQAQIHATYAAQARDLAETYADAAGTHAANALVYANAASGSAASAAGRATDAETAAADAVAAKSAAVIAKGDAQVAASAAAASAAAAATFDPALYRLKSVSITIAEVNGLQTTLNGKQALLGFTPVNKAGDTLDGALTAPLLVSTGSAALGLIVERTSSANNSVAEFRATGGSVYFGQGSSNTFAVGSAADLTNSAYRWARISASGTDLVGNLNVTGGAAIGPGATSPGDLVHISAGSGDQAAVRFSHGGILRGLIGIAGTAGQIVVGSDAGDLGLRTEGSALRLAVGGSAATARFNSAGNLLITGELTSTGNVYVSSARLRSTGSHAVLSVTGGGIIYLRPNGDGSTSGQFSVDTAGHVVASGRIHPGGSGTSFLYRTASDTVNVSDRLHVDGTFQSNRAEITLGGLYQLSANSATWVRQPRIFVQSTSPGSQSVDGDIWVQT